MAKKRISSHHLHHLICAGVIAISIIFLIRRITEYHNFLVKPLWVVETLIFFAILVSYAIRMEPLERSRGYREIVFPLVGGVTPFALRLIPPNLWIVHSLIH